MQRKEFAHEKILHNYLVKAILEPRTLLSEKSIKIQF